MRVGVFGGTFDPPHVGHLILAGEAVDQLGLQRLLWVLTPNPPHKLNQAVTSLEIRLEILQAAIEENPVFEISRVEMDRPGPHFAVDTVGMLAKLLPKAELFYLIGGDSLHDLPTWCDPQGFIQTISGLRGYAAAGGCGRPGRPRPANPGIEQQSTLYRRTLA